MFSVPPFPPSLLVFCEWYVNNLSSKPRLQLLEMIVLKYLWCDAYPSLDLLRDLRIIHEEIICSRYINHVIFIVTVHSVHRLIWLTPKKHIFTHGYSRHEHNKQNTRKWHTILSSETYSSCSWLFASHFSHFSLLVSRALWPCVHSYPVLLWAKGKFTIKMNQSFLLTWFIYHNG